MDVPKGKTIYQLKSKYDHIDPKLIKSHICLIQQGNYPKPFSLWFGMLKGPCDFKYIASKDAGTECSLLY